MTGLARLVASARTEPKDERLDTMISVSPVASDAAPVSPSSATSSNGSSASAASAALRRDGGGAT